MNLTKPIVLPPRWRFSLAANRTFKTPAPSKLVSLKSNLAISVPAIRTSPRLRCGGACRWSAIQNVDNVYTEATYPAAMKAVEDARTARAAADEACHVRVAALEAEMPGIKAQLADHEKRIAWLEKLHSLMSGVTFRTDSAQLTAPAQTALDMVANVLLRWPHDVEIRGYASSPGDEAYNIGLSDRRAKAVRAYLVNRGVSGGRISTSAYGESDAVASNDTAEGRRANQRAVVLHAGM